MMELDRALPHRGPMRLIHRIIGIDGDRAVAETVIGPDNPFFIEGLGVPGWVGIELMAQCTALVGAKAESDAPAHGPGMLLGARDFRWSKAWFEAGARLMISAKPLMGDGVLAVFAAAIEIDGRTVAEAQINIHRGMAP